MRVLLIGVAALSLSACAQSPSAWTNQPQGNERQVVSGHIVTAFTFEHYVSPSGASATLATRHDSFVPDKPERDSKH